MLEEKERDAAPPSRIGIRGGGERGGEEEEEKEWQQSFKEGERKAKVGSVLSVSSSSSSPRFPIQDLEGGEREGFWGRTWAWV